MEKESEFNLILASTIDEEDLVAELNTDQNCVAEIRQLNDGNHSIRFLNENGKNLGEMDLSFFMGLIEQAKSRLS
ncbi:MAG: hypothetical protein ABJN65_01225 [Parasphingorhabdus sp.]